MHRKPDIVSRMWYTIVLRDYGGSIMECANPECVKDGKPKYCSTSCAARVNNKKFPKRNAVPENLKYCKCGKKKDRRSITCVACYLAEIATTVGSLTLAEACYTKGEMTNRNARLRDYLRSKYKAELKAPCEACFYSKHVEACHIKAVKDFPSTALVDEVNARSNIMFLCRNCHWEFDNGVLMLGEGIGPSSALL